MLSLIWIKPKHLVEVKEDITKKIKVNLFDDTGKYYESTSSKRCQGEKNHGGCWDTFLSSSWRIDWKMCFVGRSLYTELHDSYFPCIARDSTKTRNGKLGNGIQRKVRLKRYGQSRNLMRIYCSIWITSMITDIVCVCIWFMYLFSMSWL